VGREVCTTVTVSSPVYAGVCTTVTVFSLLNELDVHNGDRLLPAPHGGLFLLPAPHGGYSSSR